MIASYHVKNSSSEPDITWTVAMADKEYVPELPETSYVLWDLSDCCSEENNAFFQVLSALVGWQSVATAATFTTYFVYWIVALFLWWGLVQWDKRKERLRAEKAAELQKVAVEASATAAASAMPVEPELTFVGTDDKTVDERV